MSPRYLSFIFSTPAFPLTKCYVLLVVVAAAVSFVYSLSFVAADIESLRLLNITYVLFNSIHRSLEMRSSGKTGSTKTPRKKLTFLMVMQTR